MKTTPLNCALHDLYHAQTAFWDDWTTAKLTENLASPLLLSVPDSYSDNSVLKVMWIGCETNGWFTYGYGNICELMEEHHINSEQMLSSYHSLKKHPLIAKYKWRLKQYKRRAFWTWAREFKARLDTLNTKNNLIIWNNLLKVGMQSKKGPIGDGSLILLKGHFRDIFLKEVEILQPDILIFACGKDSVYHSQIASLGIALSNFHSIKYTNNRGNPETLYLKKGILNVSGKKMPVLHCCHPNIITSGKGSRAKLRNEVFDAFIAQMQKDGVI